MGPGRGTGEALFVEPRPLVDRYALLEYAAAYESERCTNSVIVKKLEKMAIVGLGVPSLDRVLSDATLPLPLSLGDIAKNIAQLEKQYSELAAQKAIRGEQENRFKLLAQGGIPKVYETDRFFTPPYSRVLHAFRSTS